MKPIYAKLIVVQNAPTLIDTRLFSQYVSQLFIAIHDSCM